MFSTTSDQNDGLFADSYEQIKEHCLKEQNSLQKAVDEIIDMAEHQEHLDKGMLVILVDKMSLNFDQKYYLKEYIESYDDPIVGRVKDEYLNHFDGFLTEGQRFSLSIIGDNLAKNFKKFVDREYYSSYAQDVF